MTKRPEFPPFPEWPQPAITGLVEPGDEPIDFTPVPRQRSRRNGWTEATQRAFIAALEECASVSRSARAVGMSPRSAYRLLGAEGADSFAEAWGHRNRPRRRTRARRRDAARNPWQLGAGCPSWSCRTDGVSHQRPFCARHPVRPQRESVRHAGAGGFSTQVPPAASAPGAAACGRAATLGGASGGAPGHHRQPTAPDGAAALPNPLRSHKMATKPVTFVNLRLRGDAIAPPERLDQAV